MHQEDVVAIIVGSLTLIALASLWARAASVTQAMRERASRVYGFETASMFTEQRLRVTLAMMVVVPLFIIVAGALGHFGEG